MLAIYQMGSLVSERIKGSLPLQVILIYIKINGEIDYQLDLIGLFPIKSSWISRFAWDLILGQVSWYLMLIEPRGNLYQLRDN
jgi:hypothetical protein